jgi:flagellar hook-associated protein 2
VAGVNPTTLRLTGMASGLDTEGIVKDLMSIDKLKVDSVKKQKMLLEWKQEYYQEITSKLSAFQNKYYGTSSSGNLMGGALNMLTAAYNSPYVSILAGSSAVQGSMYISDIISLASSAKLEGTQHVSSDPKITVNTEALNDLAGKSIAVTLDGITKAVTFSSRTYATSQDVQDELSSQLAASFGGGRINVALNGDELSLSAENSTLRIGVPTDAEKNPTGILDFVNYSSNRIDFNVGLSQAGLSRDIFVSPEDKSLSFTINGKSFSFTGQNKLSDIIQAVNNSDAGVTISYSSLSDTFSMVSKASGAASSITAQDNHGFLMDALFGSARYTAGTDAVVRMSANGSKNEEDMVTVQRSTNSFTVNGSTVTLLGKAAGTEKEGISVSTSYDEDAIVEKVKAFVADYNDLLGLITKRTSEERNRDYLPLSDDEKDAMSDKEVELWTEKAKSGILRNDTSLQSIADELKSSVYSAVKELGSSDETLGILADIGIATGNYTEKGQLHLDENKLRKALSENPEKALNLLTQKSSISYSLYAPKEQQQKRLSESGVLWRLNDVLSKSLNTVGKKGALIELVGSPNSSYKGETIYSKRINDMQDRIDSMEVQLTTQEDNYYKQFSAMETALNKLNSQSSWISGMLGQTQN